MDKFLKIICVVVLVVFFYHAIGFGSQPLNGSLNLETATSDMTSTVTMLGSALYPYTEGLINLITGNDSFRKDNNELIERIETAYGVEYSKPSRYIPIIAMLFDSDTFWAYLDWKAAVDRAAQDGLITSDEYMLLCNQFRKQDIFVTVG